MNTNTVLRALRLLREEGLLEFRRGRGVTVAGTPERTAVLAKARELVDLARRRTSWIVAVGTRLYMTADQGRHWTTLTPRPGFRVSSITELAFASASDGWILTSPISNVPNAPTVFEYTTNGGRTWEPLSGS